MDFKKILPIVLVIIAVICAGIYVGGIFDNGENPPNGGENSAIGNNNSGNKPVEAGSLKIRIEYDGPFTAGYGSANKNDDFTSSGTQEIDLGDSDYVDVGAKKSDGVQDC